MTSTARCECLWQALFGLMVCSTYGSLAAAQTDGRVQPVRGLGDLTLEAADPATAVQFGQREIPEDSCQIYNGCALAAGRRTALQVQVLVRNIGHARIDLGQPWQSPYFYPSLCQQSNVLYGLISAELRDLDMTLVAKGSFASTCLADRDGGYTCMAQGLGAGGRSLQPEGQCDYLDITDLPSGDYHLSLTVNPGGEIPEANRANNNLALTVHYVACAGELCGGVCCPDGVTCVDGTCALPDLRVNAESASESLWLSHQTFGADSCELEEACVTGSGRRRLLNFEGRIENLGPGDLSPGAEHDNPLFEYSACHDHYHFVDFTDYRLLDAGGNVVAQGHKQSFCLVDMAPVDTPSLPSPPGTRPTPEPTGEPHLLGPGEYEGCNHLSAGWADIYGVGTPCQWVDVTDVAPGDYVLSLSVNPLGRIAEVTTDNNTVLVPVQISPDLPCEVQPEVCGDAIDQDCDELPDAWDEDCNVGGCVPGDPACEAPTLVSGNDSCEQAYELVDAQTVSGELQALSSTAQVACGGNGAPAYFRFELTSEQAVYLGTLGSSTDTVLALYRGGCDAAPIQCADDDCGTRGGHFVAVLPAGSYVAAVRSKRAENTGSYRLKFEHADARGAHVIGGPGVYAGTTENAGDDVQACSDYAPSGYGSGPDELYVLASCNAQVTLSTCGSSTFHGILEARTLADSIFEPALQCTANGNDACQADPLGVTLIAYTSSSGLLFVTVDGEREDDAGEYRLSVSY